MEKDKNISKNIRKMIKNNYPSVAECARKNQLNDRYLNNTISKISHGQYPSIKFLKKIAEMCGCDFTDFFKIEEQ